MRLTEEQRRRQRSRNIALVVVLATLVVLFYGHKFAREGRFHPLLVFAVVGLVNFGLTARGLSAILVARGVI